MLGGGNWAGLGSGFPCIVLLSWEDLVCYNTIRYDTSRL